MPRVHGDARHARQSPPTAHLSLLLLLARRSVEPPSASDISGGTLREQMVSAAGLSCADCLHVQNMYFLCTPPPACRAYQCQYISCAKPRSKNVSWSKDTFQRTIRIQSTRLATNVIPTAARYSVKLRHQPPSPDRPPLTTVWKHFSVQKHLLVQTRFRCKHKHLNARPFLPTNLRTNCRSKKVNLRHQPPSSDKPR